MKIRAFIALEFEKTLRNAVKAAQQRLRAAQADVKWVDEPQMHLTVKFLGDHFDLKDVPVTLDIMREVTAGMPKIDILLKGLDAFPNLRAPRVIVAHVRESAGELLRVQRDLETKISENIGYPPEQRKFKPHLTLGRVRSDKNIDQLIDLIEQEKETLIGKQLLTKMVLFSSELLPQGPVYSPLGIVDF